MAIYPRPFIRQPPPRKPEYPQPGFAATGAQGQPQQPAFVPMPPPPKSLTSPTTQPGPQLEPWLQAVGTTARVVARGANRDLAQQPPVQQAGFNQQQNVDPATAAKELAQRSPTLAQATSDPAATIEQASGRDVDDIFAEMREMYGEKIPTDLDRREKGMLLMEMGFGIMSGGPGLARAIGQAGMHTMGSWRDLRQQKLKEGLYERRGRQEMLGTEAGLRQRQQQAEADREAAMARTEARTQAQMQEGETRREHDVRMEELRQQHRLERDQLGAKTSADSTALMKNAAYLARVKDWPEDRAADYLLASAANRQDPDAFRRNLVKTIIGGKFNPDAGDAQEAVEMANEIIAQLDQGPDAMPAPPEAGGQPTKGVWAAIKEMVPGLSSQEDASEPPAAEPAAQPPAPQAPASQEPAAQQGGRKPIDQMGKEELQSLADAYERDPSTMSQEELRKAAERWDALNSGG